MADIIIISILAALVFLILRSRLQRSGRGSCQGGCAGCSGCCGCGKRPAEDAEG